MSDLQVSPANGMHKIKHISQCWSTSDRKVSGTESRVCSRNDASVDVRRPQPATTDVGDGELTVVDEVQRRQL